MGVFPIWLSVLGGAPELYFAVKRLDLDFEDRESICMLNLLLALVLRLGLTEAHAGGAA